MARIATIAAGMALMLGQPTAAAWAQSTDNNATQTTSQRSGQRSGNGFQSFFRGHPDRIILALGALGAVILGLATISKGHNNDNGPRPTSP